MVNRSFIPVEWMLLGSIARNLQIQVLFIVKVYEVSSSFFCIKRPELLTPMDFSALWKFGTCVGTLMRPNPWIYLCDFKKVEFGCVFGSLEFFFNDLPVIYYMYHQRIQVPHLEVLYLIFGCELGGGDSLAKALHSAYISDHK